MIRWEDSTLRGVCPRLWSRAPAAAEAPRRVRSRGSHIDLADGLETGSPYFHLYSPGLALSRGGSLSCSSSPLSESALICSSFSPRRFICFVPSGLRVAVYSSHRQRAWSFTPALSCGNYGCGSRGGTTHSLWSLNWGCWDHPPI